MELKLVRRTKEDSVQKEVEEELIKWFSEKSQQVFYSRQIEVIFEDKYFHWITNRALRNLEQRRIIKSEARELRNSGNINLYWNKDYRYYRRTAKQIIELVEMYADPNFSGALGTHGELLVLEGFAKCECVMKGRNCNEYNGIKWKESEHDLDFIFEKDSLVYGIEVKNMLGYMDYKELKIKLRMCKQLQMKPIIVARMLPKSWINEIIESDGFALILKYQLYPTSHKDVCKRVSEELGLPVDSPRALYEGTMQRFLN